MTRAPAAQLQLFEESAPALPPGLAYRPGFVSAAEEAALAARLGELSFEPFRFRGYEGRRRVVSFGWRYDFDKAGLAAAPPIPDWLAPLRERAAALADLPPDAFAHVLINEYRPGAPIGWHRDRPVFERVVGVSLLAPSVLRLRRRRPDGFARTALPLARRSAYLLAGEARDAWEHSIAEAAELRYSITFRNLRQPGRP